MFQLCSQEEDRKSLESKLEGHSLEENFGKLLLSGDPVSIGCSANLTYPPDEGIELIHIRCQHLMKMNSYKHCFAQNINHKNDLHISLSLGQLSGLNHFSNSGHTFSLACSSLARDMLAKKYNRDLTHYCQVLGGLCFFIHMCPKKLNYFSSHSVDFTCFLSKCFVIFKCSLFIQA